MSPKKQYQKKLPTVMPPKPRPEPEADLPATPPLLPAQASGPELEQVREAIRKLVSDLDDELGPEAGPAALPVGPVARPARPAPDPVEGRRRPIRTLLPLALVVLVAAALGGGLLVWRLAGDRATDQPSAAAPGWPPAGASRTVTRVRADGTLDVTHWIHTASPIDALDLSLPDVELAGSVRAYGVDVEADGRPGTGPGEVTAAQASYVFAGATRIRVHYRLSGVVERSDSAAGRALATTTALQVSATQPRDVRVVRSGAVLSLACARSGAADPTPCGESDGVGEWRVTLDGTDTAARVVAAVTLPS